MNLKLSRFALIWNCCTMKKNRTTYKRIPVYIIMLLGLLICHACSEDSDVNVIRVQIEANSDEPVRIYGVKEGGELGLVIRRSYDTTFELRNDGFSYGGFSIEARCKDENTLITIKVWVNGKFKVKVSGNKYLTSGYISL